MRKINIVFAIATLVLCLTIFSCKKENYLTDGGVHTAQSTLSTYDYLANHQYHYFDTVLLIVDHFHLKDSINKSGTFFAPTDFSVNRMMKALNAGSLDELYDNITSKFITQYLFTDSSLTLDNATTAMKIYPNWADTIAGIKKLPASYVTVSSSLTYYTLQYVKINGYPDNSPDAPVDDLTDAVLNCQTTGIKTATGTTLHVLSNASSLSAK